MKGDMGGAAAVVATIRALAARAGQVNVVGAIGVVENMPDGKGAAPRRRREVDVPGRRSKS